MWFDQKIWRSRVVSDTGVQIRGNPSNKPHWKKADWESQNFSASALLRISGAGIDWVKNATHRGKPIKLGFRAVSDGKAENCSPALRPEAIISNMVPFSLGTYLPNQ